nr:4-hydroxy-3-methylbut-2-enyl diphosphate reductase [Allopontixanthobacter sediminis]
MKVLLAAPRGFCAGVVRALETLDTLLARQSAPIFVNHEIVHNPHLVEQYRERGVVFSDDLDAIPEGGTLVVSAHGAAPSLFIEARRRNLRVVDSTCPLVTKVHNEVRHHSARPGHHVLLIGHGDHVEVVGSFGYAQGACTIISDIEAARSFQPKAGVRYACAMQTTLSVADIGDILSALRGKIPDLLEPAKSDICYATTNRQNAVANMAGRCDAVLIIGGANSSNSRRLVEMAERAGCPRTHFVSRGAMIDPRDFAGVSVLGISSGASTPEPFIEEALEVLSAHFEISVEELGGEIEDQHYKVPPLGRDS